jgi:hypothetical protein
LAWIEGRKKKGRILDMTLLTQKRREGETKERRQTPQKKNTTKV